MAKTKCEHGKDRTVCKLCGGGSICEHAKRRSKCKDCKALGVGGSEVCEHGVQQRECKPCRGSAVCEHDRFRRRCKDCGGANICEHGKQRQCCKDCGSQICEHGKQRQCCKDCGGSQICEHRRYRRTCSKCNPEGAYKLYKKNAKYTNKSFELTLEEFKWLISYPCSLCGEASEPMGVDRVNSDYGYSFANCQTLCADCNEMKWDRTEEEFDQQIIKIIQHRPELVQRAGFQVSRAA